MRRTQAQRQLARWPASRRPEGLARSTRDLGNSWRRSFARWPFKSVGWTRLSPALAFDLVLYVPVGTPIVPL